MEEGREGGKVGERKGGGGGGEKGRGRDGSKPTKTESNTVS